LINAILSAAAIYYLWVYANPVSDTDKQYYVAIEAFLITIGALKFLFFYMLFNFHRRTVGIILSFLTMVLALIISLVLIILFAIQTAWISFALMFPPAIFFLLLILWTYQIWQHAKTSKTTGGV
jgi:hypothetical protein